MISRDIEVSDADLAGQAVPAADSAEETPGAEITDDVDANIADVIEQHHGVPSGEDDYPAGGGGGAGAGAGA